MQDFIFMLYDYFRYTVPAVFVFSCFSIWLCGHNKIYTETGRAYSDYFWVGFSAITITFTALIWEYGGERADLKKNTRLHTELISKANRESRYLSEKWCDTRSPVDLYDGREELRSIYCQEFCSVLIDTEYLYDVYYREESEGVKIVSPPNSYCNKSLFEDLQKKYPTDGNGLILVDYSQIHDLNIPRIGDQEVARNESEHLLISDARKSLGIDVMNVNFRADKIREQYPRAKYFRILEISYLLFIHLLAIAAAFRLGRSRHDLVKAKL